MILDKAEAETATASKPRASGDDPFTALSAAAVSA